MPAACISCSRPLGWMARLGGDSRCGSCATSAAIESQAAIAQARTLHPEHAWGHHYELPQVSDRDMRRLLERISRAMPHAAVAQTDHLYREAMNMVWPDMMECAARMNGTPTEDCYSYLRPADAMATVRQITEAEQPNLPLFLTYWRVWWTAASHIGRPATLQTIVDASLTEEVAHESLDALTSMAYIAHFGPRELAGTDLNPGYLAFLDCEGCQNWRSDWRQS